MSAGHPTPLSMLGSVFSHQRFDHILWNGFILFLVGPIVCDEIGRGNFLALFVVSGVSANLVSLWYHVLFKNYLLASLGMSGALWGVIAAYWLIADRRRIGSENWGFEYPGWVVYVAVLLIEVASWRKMTRLRPDSAGGTSDHANHVGGLVTGAILGVWLRWRKAEERKAWEEYDAGEVPASGESAQESATTVTTAGQDVR